MAGRYIRINGVRVWNNTVNRCNCLGYHFPHRKGSGACESSPCGDYYQAKRHGMPESEAQALLSVAQLERMFPVG